MLVERPFRGMACLALTMVALYQMSGSVLGAALGTAAVACVIT